RQSGAAAPCACVFSISLLVVPPGTPRPVKRRTEPSAFALQASWILPARRATVQQGQHRLRAFLRRFEWQQVPAIERDEAIAEEATVVLPPDHAHLLRRLAGDHSDGIADRAQPMQRALGLAMRQARIDVALFLARDAQRGAARALRSEERRVGKEGTTTGAPDTWKRSGDT